MRLHHLEITAFGPFAGTVEVDFDELSAGGLFLLTGATGAGKTSVLDAVCFALYGQVPGDRASARHLRSDHAPAGVAPRVVLRVSIGERTFRFTRSPAWLRPKLRGSGETRIQAHVVVEEHRGEWVPLTNRLDDAGLLVTDLLGMTAAQFTQVAMLPQGRFQAFLRATSTERHAVLQKLFRTDRFEQVERWLVDRRGAARRASGAAVDRVTEVLNRLQEAAHAMLPESWSDDPDTRAVAAERGQLAAWSADLVTASVAERSEAAGLRLAADSDRDVAAATLADGRRIHELQQRAETAGRELADLLGRAEELATLRRRLDAHRLAAPLEPLVARAAECRRTADLAAARWHDRLAALSRECPIDEPSRAGLAALQRDAVADRAVADAFRPRAAELANARALHAAREHELLQIAAELTELEAAIAEHPVALATAKAAYDQAHATATGLPLARQEAERLQEVLVTSRRHTVLTDELTTAQRDLVVATQHALSAKEAYLDIREARINGMAVELAGALAVGCACPVCGSAEHPAPAGGGGARLGRAEEDAARKAHEDAAFSQQGHEVRVATLTTELESLTARLDGVDRGALPAQLAIARELLESTTSLAGELDARAERVRILEGELDAARESRSRALLARATVSHERDASAATVEARSAELDALLAGLATDLESLIALRAAHCTLVDAAVDAFATHDETTRLAAQADDAARAAVRKAGFDDAEAAAHALLRPDRAEEVEAVLMAADAARLAAENALADPATKIATGQPAPDLEALEALERGRAAAAQAAASRLDAATSRSQRLSALDRTLAERLEDWAPLREHHALVASLSQLVEGKGPDNPLKIRLAAYVLSERLRQVVAAANERLTRMTGQRYSLEHTDDRGAGEQRGGLSLLVRDAWNGVPRDPATLSGGETFVVSLALALGLADTVAHEAGGTDIDTLFIDEGFGSLDPETLEDVMDTLDTLRDGGRVVGLVSHVPELRSRIATQLEVRKDRGGSTLRPVLAGG
jgi:DNA repair protein SbcC/Rad50